MTMLDPFLRLQELETDGVNAAHVLRAEGVPSPFTYVIVDKEGASPLY